MICILSYGVENKDSFMVDENKISIVKKCSLYLMDLISLFRYVNFLVMVLNFLDMFIML